MSVPEQKHCSNYSSSVLCCRRCPSFFISLSLFCCFITFICDDKYFLFHISSFCMRVFTFLCFFFFCLPPFCLNRTIRTECFRYLFSSLVSFISLQSNTWTKSFKLPKPLVGILCKVRIHICTEWDWELLCSQYKLSIFLGFLGYDIYNMIWRL